MSKIKKTRRVYDNNLDAVLKSHGIPIGEVRKRLNDGVPENSALYVKQSTLSCYTVHGGGLARPDKELARRIAAIVSKLARQKYSIVDLFPHYGRKKLGVAVVIEDRGEMVADFNGDLFGMVRK